MSTLTSQADSSHAAHGDARVDALAYLEQKFAAILSPRRPLSRLEAALAGMEVSQAAFMRRWVDVIAKSNLELAYEFAMLSGAALTRFSERGARAWILDALATYDREGLYPAVSALGEIEQFAARHRRARARVRFAEVAAHLHLFLRGLSGRDLQLAVADPGMGKLAYTDTETLYLPAELAHYPTRKENRQLYKAMAVILWAQTVYGTFRRSSVDAPKLAERFDTYPNPAQAERVFLQLETVRLLAAIKRDLPGLNRQMATMTESPPSVDQTWTVLKARLEDSAASVDTTFEVLDVVLARGCVPGDYAFSSGFELELVDAAMRARHQHEAAVLAAELAGMMSQSETDDDGVEAGEGGRGESLPCDQPLPPGGLSEPLQQLVDSLLQDFDELPDFNALENAASTVEDAALESVNSRMAEEASQVFYYDEWDYARQAYREQWCRVIEREIPVPENDYRAQVIAKYPHLVKAIHRVFDSLRDAPVMLKKQTDGEEIDLDAALVAEVDRRSGQEISERIYLRRNHEERSVAVMILVDVSGSTKGWINQAERESLILICEALDRLDDRYALMAFSGMTRERCEVFPMKDFDEANTLDVQARIGGLQPRYYTRMGAAIRHATEMLDLEQAKHRILLVLSDGKPDDYDGYKGDYGIEDTRRALIEARGKAIKPFCITIDADAQDYLPHLFGESGYTLLDDVGKLPLKIADIYRRLSVNR